MRCAESRNGLQSCKAPNAVICMYDEVANREAGCFGQNIGGFADALSLAHQPIAEDILLCDDDEIGRFKPVFQSKNAEAGHSRFQSLQLGKVLDLARVLQSVVGKQRDQALTGAR